MYLHACYHSTEDRNDGNASSNPAAVQESARDELASAGTSLMTQLPWLSHLEERNVVKRFEKAFAVDEPDIVVCI